MRRHDPNMLPRALLVLMPVIAAAMSASDAGGTTLDGCTGCSDWCTRDCPATCTGVSNNHTVWTASPVPVATVVNGKRFSAGGPDLNPNIALVHVSVPCQRLVPAEGWAVGAGVSPRSSAVGIIPALGALGSRQPAMRGKARGQHLVAVALQRKNLAAKCRAR